MEKRFITANELLLDSFKLAEQIFVRGFRPHFIIGVWRGGSPVGIAVQEYLEYKGVSTDHIAIRTSSYTGIDQQDKHIRVHGMDYVIKNVEAEQELLIVDDVFDSGRSIAAILDTIKAKCRRNTPHTIKIACPWYKPSRNVTNITPDFYVRATDQWLVFPHELCGLTEEEILQGKGSEIADTLSRTPSSSDS
ncbi:phosphoribosyltransferase [Teredinibacter turnerae]|uniref:Phosphoribosyltransferase n=1 Tax=Teredinibacter turnerae (strain ATCC 39867 / T7901) TaxID=377629 RepID=C5BIT6_TERTT|nr:phosphoribosyltransferase family protein [Teredinibacter turnerae]ACR13255.1 putative phosphoribosyltransferase [Teredinibacter turnerae T7901]